MRTFLAGVLLVACSGSVNLGPKPKGYAARMTEAQRHERLADDQQLAAHAAAPTDVESYSCGDRVLADQATSGGAPLTPVQPCWNLAEESAAHHRYQAAKERRLAREDRVAAANLVAAERLACRDMPAQELEHSPFAHTQEIADVVAHHEAGKVVGARIIFKPVRGLDAAWMRQAIACHRAVFARMGEPASYLPEDPTLVAGAVVRVEDHRDHVEVIVTSKQEVGRAVALARAKDLVHAQTATRD